MKKYLILAICFALIFAISGCLAVSGISGTSSDEEGTTLSDIEMEVPTSSTAGGPLFDEDIVIVPIPTGTDISATETTNPDETPTETTIPATNTIPGTTGVATDLYYEYIDHGRTEITTEEEIQLILPGMTVAQVVEILGPANFQDGMPSVGFDGLCWLSTRGVMYVVHFRVDGERTEDLNEMFIYGICTNVESITYLP